MNRILSILVFSILSSVFVSAQETDSVKYPTFRIDGVMKNKFEYAFETSNTRFSVRNSRIGVRGNLAEPVSYRAQLELSDNGNFRVLDLYGTLHLAKGLKLSLGQNSIPLFNSYVVNPGAMMFANRAFLAKYFLGTRDIGALAEYAFRTGGCPVSLEFGLFNGNAINAPVWREQLSYGGRLQLGSMKGLRATAKFYDYPQSNENHLFLYGADLRYESSNWKVETEIMKRDDKINSANNMLSYYIQGAYALPLNFGKIFKHIIPAARWDAIDQSLHQGGFDVNRLTVGLGFGFKQKLFSSLIRLDYEKYFVNRNLPALGSSAEMDSDKLTLELLLTF